MLRDMEKSLEAAKRMIEETRQILDDAKDGGGDKGKKPKK
jgi:hypothetical protein